MGYIVTEIHEVHHWERWAKFCNANEPSLFGAYVNAFLKMKLESSGWPEWCTTDAQKDQFIADCHAQDGITLDRTVLDQGPNPALRFIAVCFLKAKTNL